MCRGAYKVAEEQLITVRGGEDYEFGASGFRNISLGRKRRFQVLPIGRAS
jgi:hypothetical protein